MWLGLRRYGANLTGQTAGRGLHSFPIQLRLSSSVHIITRLSSRTCPGVAHIEL